MARRRKRNTRLYRNVPAEQVARYASTLLAQIKQHLSNVVSFTRDDLIRLPISEFDQVAFVSRYRATCIAVAYLIEHNELITPKFPELCLPANAQKYRFEETSVSESYAPTIRRLVNSMPQNFSVMHVVNKWRTDPHLTLDIKRKAVRNSMPRLVREGICKPSGYELYEVTS